MRKFITLCLMASVFIADANMSEEQKAPSVGNSKPNVIVILADDLGYGDVGYHPHSESDVVTPNIDKLAKRSAVFSAGYAMAPVCGPSRAGLLTGRYQNRFGFEDNPGGPFRQSEQVEPGIPLSEQTMGEYFQHAGYQTAWIGKDHQAKRPEFHPNNRGFDHFYGFQDGASTYFTETSDKQKLEVNGKPIATPAYLTDAFGLQAVDFITRSKDKPFFLYLPFNAVHGPLEATKQDLKRFAHIKDKKRRTMLAMNFAMDRNIGKVYQTLNRYGLQDNTLIVFYSDNGGKLKGNASLNTPLNGRKGMLMEGGIRVPFFIHWPAKVLVNQQYHFPVAAIDIFPTLVAAIEGGPSKQAMDGKNLLPHIGESQTAVQSRTLYWRFLYQWAVRDDEWKLVKLKGDKGLKLFNLKNDQSETRNLIASHPKQAARLKRQFNLWSSQMMQPQWSWQQRFGGPIDLRKDNKKLSVSKSKLKEVGSGE